ncbi:palmitoyltransferase ZDHHC21-like isoform X1 [Crassostrea angulata]|uniref:palmitoyltransferase ZDHHC21-like isoform X1 n=1 Tax=Magallana angulata TaxID=2784310 RepID=UPI0022B1A0EE|nr:palmitoyltransferase ZDHHC21-like isoform X1 [Crassostrea angulata]XP_052685808.1 palmitoyltransferase ZDHHC21-like isoform X1 [Crassostrea angulata]
MYEKEEVPSLSTFVSGLGLDNAAPSSEYSSNIIVKSLPILGRLHFVKDRNGILSLTFTFLYWVYGTWCGLVVVLLPHMRDKQASEPFVALYVLCSVMCICALFRAATLNPGRVPLISEKDNIDTSDWEMCDKCQRKRPKRAHHCRRCQQCVLRMDHHCPWINNCVGEENHYAFMQLLFWAFCLSWMAFWSLMLHYWYYPACITCDKSVFYIKHSIWFKYLLVLMSLAMGLFMGAGLVDQHQNLNWESFEFIHEAWFTYILTALAIFMGIMMGGQLIGQHFSLLLDRTTLENMKDPHPDISTIRIRSEWSAYREMCGSGSMLFWLFPCRSRKVLRPSYFYSSPV